MIRHSILAPAVIQTSATDCGPASLKCLLEGHGIAASYGRLREACQTDIDGSSISTISDVASQLGLEAEEIILPADHLLIDEARALPAVVVARLPNGFTHFLVIWRSFGNVVQVMDPAIGRRWMPISQLVSELFVHETTVPASDWRDWAATEEFAGTLRHRIARLGISPHQYMDTAVADPTWRTFAALDASVRSAEALCRNGGMRHGAGAGLLLQHLLEGAQLGNDIIPPGYWSVRPCEQAEGEEQYLRMRGAVLVRIRGRKPDTPQIAEGPLSSDIVTALQEKRAGPWRELWTLLRQSDAPLLLPILGALTVAAAGVILEALLFRAILDVNRYLGLFEQRVGAIAALLLFVALFLALDIPLASVAMRLGRGLECRLRLAWFEKLARLPDRYFRSRLTSDMVERSHSTHALRNLVMLGSRVCRAAATLAITAAAMCWIDPRIWFPTIITAVLVVAIPVIGIPLLNERELRVRTHSGALSRFSLDALLGLVAIRAHSAERSIRRQHESLMVEWTRSALSLHRAVASLETLQTCAVLALVGWIVLSHVAHSGMSGLNLLLIFWALSLPVLGQEIAIVLRQAPTYRNVTARLLELLRAPEEIIATPNQEADETPVMKPGIEISCVDLTVRIAGRNVLKNVNLNIPAGGHVAIVGPSGAGKSTLAGVLLGFHRPFAGAVFADQQLLDAVQIEKLRGATAWVDPDVHIWNRTLLENIHGGVQRRNAGVGAVIESSELVDLLVALPNGLQTKLGEGGGLVSGGEGQRVRLARAMFRPDVRLVLLDEPFRGLDRERRRDLLLRSRAAWCDATLLCITHDIAETTLFDYVVVIEDGLVVEQGVPAMMAASAGSRYRRMLDAEAALREATWSGALWRRWRVSGGSVVEDHDREKVSVRA